MTDDLVSTGQVAEMLGVSRWTVIRMIDRGDLQPVTRAMGGYVFDRATIETLARETQPGGDAA